MSFGNTGEFSGVAEDGYLSLVVSVSTSQVQAKVGSTNLAKRQAIIIYNDSNNVVYYGPSGVTTTGSTKGIPIGPGGFLTLPMGAEVSVFLIAGSASNVIIQEVA